MHKYIIMALLALSLAPLGARAADAEDTEDAVAIQDDGANSDANASVTQYKEKLAPDGRWVQVKAADYDWVFVPDVATKNPGWQPYVDGGHWAWTDAGWYWQSDYAWGETCFHYGRWVSTEFGWAWVPGSQWAPAWVCWRECDGYYGWAALPPCTHFTVGIGFFHHGRRCGLGFDFGIGVDGFCFVGSSDFLQINIGGHRCKHDECVKIYNKTVIRNTYVYRNGHICAHPFRREAIEAHTHIKLEVRVIAKAEHERAKVIAHEARKARNEHVNHEAIKETREARKESKVIQGEKKQEQHQQKQEQRQEKREEQHAQKQEQHQQRQEQRQEQHQQKQERQAPPPQHAAPPPQHFSPPPAPVQQHHR